MRGGMRGREGGREGGRGGGREGGREGERERERERERETSLCHHCDGSDCRETCYFIPQAVHKYRQTLGQLISQCISHRGNHLSPVDHVISHDIT